MRIYRNKYKSRVNGFEAMMKDISSWWFVLTQLIKTGNRPESLLCYPDYPGSRTIIRKVCRELGMEVHNRPERKYRLSMAYQDVTAMQKQTLDPIGNGALNSGCLDISKDKVDEVCQEVFGYSTRIDPEAWTGEAVEKSLENAVHDGRVVQCPVGEKREGAIYQVVIDNRVSDGEVVDMRVAVTGNELPLVYLKYKTIERRFTNETHLSRLAKVHDHLSEEEVQQILRFSKSFGLDYGELDVLRDRGSGKIFIVDVNKTPYGPPAHLPRKEASEAVRILADSFRRQFLK